MNRHHQTAAYLLNASNFLPNNAQYTSVRSHLISKCKELMKRPLDDLQRCTACGTNFKNVLPNHQIKPVSVPNRFQRRHLRDDDYKTKYQALRMKQFHTKIYNQQKLVTVCKMCKKTHTTPLTKPPNILTTKVIKQVAKNQKKNEKKKRKRLQKKKSREFAGLNESVVLSVVNDLNNCSSPKSDTDSRGELTVGDNSCNSDDRLCDSPIIISDSPQKPLHSDSVIELSENEMDTSVILLSSPSSESSNADSDIFFIDASPSSTSSNKSKKLNKLALTNSMKSSNPKLIPLTPSAAGNINQVHKNQSPKLSKKQKRLLKQNNTNLNSTLVTETANTPKQNVGKNKNNKNKILAQPMKKDKKSQKLNCLANLLNNNNDGARTKSTSMLSEFLKTIK